AGHGQSAVEAGGLVAHQNDEGGGGFRRTLCRKPAMGTAGIGVAEAAGGGREDGEVHAGDAAEPCIRFLRYGHKTEAQAEGDTGNGKLCDPHLSFLSVTGTPVQPRTSTPSLILA